MESDNWRAFVGGSSRLSSSMDLMETLIEEIEEIESICSACEGTKEANRK